MTKTPSRQLSLSLLAAGLLALTAVTAGLALTTSRTTTAAEVVVYKSPTCGCCSKWVEHLEAHGFTVDARDVQDLAPIKAEAGIDRRLQSCHTAHVDGYVVEGHVPADLVARMLNEKPDIHGLAVPGMPMGSPGMEGPRKDDYNVYAVGRDGSLSVYARR